MEDNQLNQKYGTLLRINESTYLKKSTTTQTYILVEIKIWAIE